MHIVKPQGDARVTADRELRRNPINEQDFGRSLIASF